MSIGFGVSDVITACVFVWDSYERYHDAEKEFDNVAREAKATYLMLKRLQDEMMQPGSLVERGGPNA